MLYIFFQWSLINTSKGPVNLSLYHLFVIHICKQVEPIFCVINIATLFFVAGKVIIKTFGSILDVLHGLSIKLFSNGEWMWWSTFKNLQACGYHVPLLSVDTECFPCRFTIFGKNLSATNMFLSLDMDSVRISLFFGSIDGYPKPDVFWANLDLSFIDDKPRNLFSSCNILFGLYFWIQLHIATWLLLTMCRKDNALAAPLVDNPRKYKYRP